MTEELITDRRGNMERERECAQGKVLLYPSVLASLADVLTSEPRCLPIYYDLA